MKLNKLFLLLLALPLAFAACTDTPDEVKKEAQLTLTSADTLEFSAAGGTAEISYALVNPTEGVELTATADTEWVKVVAGDKVRVTVEANNGEYREAKVTVAFGNKSFDVAVKQAAQEAKGYLYDMEMAYAERYDLSEYDFPYNYYLIAFYSADGNILMGAVIVGKEGEEILSAGTYTAANGGLMMEGFELYVGENEEYFFEGGDGTIVVGGDIYGYTFDIEIANAEGQNFHFTYEGTVEAMNPRAGLPTEPFNITAEHFDGNYYGTDFSTAHNYYIMLSDKGLNDEGYACAGGNYYQIDLYSVQGSIDGDGYIHIPAGTYTFDANDTMTEWTVGNKYSNYSKIDVTGTDYEAKASFDGGKVVVTENSMVVELTVNGVLHTVTYNNAPKIYVGSGNDVEFTANYAYGSYYGDMYSPGVADNYFFFLSDLGLNEYGNDCEGGTYYRFDIYAPITDNMTITPGTYVIDVNDTLAAGTVSAYYTQYYRWGAGDYDAVDYAAGGFITFNEDGSIYAEVLMTDSGITHKVYYKGDIVITDDIGGSAGGDDNEGETLTTLTGNYTCTLNNHTLIYMNHGDFYGNGLKNWSLLLMPNSGQGETLSFDLLTDADSADIVGTYAINDSYSAYTSRCGHMVEGTMVGSWLYTSDYSTAAPFVDGTLYVTKNSDGTYTVALAVVDDAGNYIDGTWTGMAMSFGGSSAAKTSLVVNNNVAPAATKERIEVKQINKASAPSKGLKLR